MAVAPSCLYCSGSVGAFTAAELAYGQYLSSVGWRPVESHGATRFHQGNAGEEIALVVASTSASPSVYDAFPGSKEALFDKPLGSTDILVTASFADRGRASKQAKGRTVIFYAAALTFAPAVVVALLTPLRRSTGKQPSRAEP